MFSKTIILISFNQSNDNFKNKYTEIRNFNFYMGAIPTQTQSPDYRGKYLNWAYTVYIQNNWFPGVLVGYSHTFFLVNRLKLWILAIYEDITILNCLSNLELLFSIRSWFEEKNNLGINIYLCS